VPSETKVLLTNKLHVKVPCCTAHSRYCEGKLFPSSSHTPGLPRACCAFPFLWCLSKVTDKRQSQDCWVSLPLSPLWFSPKRQHIIVLYLVTSLGMAGQPLLSFSIHLHPPTEMEKRSWSQAFHPAIQLSGRLPLVWACTDALPRWARRCLQPVPRLPGIHQQPLPPSWAIPCSAQAIWTVTSSWCWYGCLRALKAMEALSKSPHVTKMTYFPHLSGFKCLVSRLHRAYFWLGKCMLFSTVDFFNWWCLRWFMSFQEPKSNHITVLFLHYYSWIPFKAQFKGHL